MDNIKFAQEHLIQKGVPEDLTETLPFLLSWLPKSNGKPMVFQSIYKIVLMYTVLGSASYSAFMYLLTSHIGLFDWQSYMLTSVAFGFSLALVQGFRVKRAHNRLGGMWWEEWCEKNYGDTP
ncbi:magnesium transporter [Vibrio sp. S9_S30]|uniref:DUF6404 family protein n=1 Tax=Vibrio sp. S9_S30 TaxID=2720226 RepID=UPI0016807766|nr:DUF6404 family protein [Vibrio sp. S9_S30]MBD1559988.1 magnesium transporter [Vibrio sp. S9_S30]